MVSRGLDPRVHLLPSSPAMTNGTNPLSLAPSADALHCWDCRCANGPEVQMLAHPLGPAVPGGPRKRPSESMALRQRRACDSHKSSVLGSKLRSATLTELADL